MMYKHNLRNTIIFIIISASIVLILFQITTYSYLLFHSLIEIFAIIIACAVFVIGWNSKADNDFFMFIGIAYLFIAGIDILHTLSYYGTGIFPGYDADLPTQLWVLGRYIESASLLVAPILIKIGLKLKKNYVLVGYFAVVSVLVTLVLIGVFPSCFITGEGLTLFKIASEYAISGILVISAIIFYMIRENIDEDSLNYFFAAIVFTIAAEMSFTLYSDVYGFANMIGHYLRFISYYMVYKAVIEITLIRPYDSMFKSLKSSEQALIGANEFLKLTTKVIRHDLRNELGRISLGIELYQQTKDDAILDEVFESIVRSTLLIESTNQMALAYEGLIKFQAIDVRKCLLEVTSDSILKVSIKGDGIALADSALNSVFRNIVMNAEKHSKTDRLEIQISNTKDIVKIKITDFGIGIPSEIIHKIFDEGFTTNPEKGSGIGLYISEKIVTGYNGQISVESRSPEGTTFLITLPRA